jgi:hypothetical protein
LYFAGDGFHSAFPLPPATAGQDSRRFFECALDFSGFAFNSVLGTVFHTSLWLVLPAFEPGRELSPPGEK